MRIASLDHLVLTVRDVEATAEFYGRVLGMTYQWGDGRHFLQFGAQRINLHELGNEREPKAAAPTPGSGDLCFLSPTPMETILEQLRVLRIDVVEGPVERDGGLGQMLSVYVRDPDGNLVEISNVL